MCNQRLDESKVPGFETASLAKAGAPNVPDTNRFSEHSVFAPVFFLVVLARCRPGATLVPLGQSSWALPSATPSEEDL